MKEVITDAAAVAQHPKLFPSAQSRVAVRECVRLERQRLHCAAEGRRRVALSLAIFLGS